MTSDRLATPARSGMRAGCALAGDAVGGRRVHVEVASLDAHYERARAAGATILREPEDLTFGRLYSAPDLEGHRWMFMQPA